MDLLIRVRMLSSLVILNTYFDFRSTYVRIRHESLAFQDYLFPAENKRVLHVTQ